MDRERLLREYVRAALREDDGGGGDYGGGMGYGGMSFGSGRDFYNVFIKPFTDVFSTAAAETKKLSQRAQTTARVAFEAIATTVLPWFGSDYKEIFKQEKEKLDAIKQQYKDVYDATWTAFKDNDVVIAAFMYNPVAVITSTVAAKTPETVANLLSVLTGGTMDNFLGKVKNKYKFGDEKKPLERGGKETGAWSNYAGAYGSGGFGGGGDIGLEGVVREAAPIKKQEPTVGQVLAHPKVLAKVESSPKVQAMEKAVRGAVDATLAGIVKRAESIAHTKSLVDLEKSFGKKLPGAEKLAQVPRAERARAETELLSTVKKSVLSMYVKNLESQAQQATGAGIGRDHPYVKAYAAAINKIKSLS